MSDTVTMPSGLARATLDALRDLIRESRDPGTGTLATEWQLSRLVGDQPRAGLGAMADVLSERARQDAKWGEQNHDPFVYGAILGEELGEFLQAALKARFESSGARESIGYMQDMRAEAVQVAAVALAIIECLDRGKWQWGGHAQA